MDGVLSNDIRLLLKSTYLWKRMTEMQKMTSTWERMKYHFFTIGKHTMIHCSLTNFSKRLFFFYCLNAIQRDWKSEVSYHCWCFMFAGNKTHVLFGIQHFHFEGNMHFNIQGKNNKSHVHIQIHQLNCSFYTENIEKVTLSVGMMWLSLSATLNLSMRNAADGTIAMVHLISN